MVDVLRVVDGGVRYVFEPTIDDVVVDSGVEVVFDLYVVNGDSEVGDGGAECSEGDGVGS